MAVVVQGEPGGAGATVAAWKELSEGPIRTADVERVAAAVKGKLPLWGVLGVGGVRAHAPGSRAR